MDSQTVIMLQIADRAWTLEALHTACAQARSSSAKIALLKLIPVQHLRWLGTAMGSRNISEQERRDIDEYQSIMEDYGVDGCLYLFQYTALADAISEAADAIDAQVVFAVLPNSILPFWHDYQLQALRRRLARSGRTLIEPTASARSVPAFADEASAGALSNI